MKREEAKEILRIKLSELRRAEIMLEMNENDVREMKEDIKELEAIINKKDDWREKLIQPNSSAYFYIGYGVEGVTTYTDRNVDRKPEHAFRKPSHAQLLADKMQLMQEMYAFAHVKNEGWIADWRDGSVNKFGIAYNSCSGFITKPDSDCNLFIFGVSVKSMEIADEMFEEFGERIEEIYNKQY